MLYQSVTLPKVLVKRRQVSKGGRQKQRKKTVYSCYTGGRCLDLLLFSSPVRESGEDMLCVELLERADLVTVVGIRDDGYWMRNALLTWALASISSTWSEISTLQTRDVRHGNAELDRTRIPFRRQLGV